jgi:hypothetical protein
MARARLADLTNRQRTLIVRSFLNKQLTWLDRVCLVWSSQAATGDVYAKGQYEHFKKYRATVKHLHFLAGKNDGGRLQKLAKKAG